MGVTEYSGLLKCDGEPLDGWFIAAGRNDVSLSSSSRNDDTSHRGRPEGGPFEYAAEERS